MTRHFAISDYGDKEIHDALTTQDMNISMILTYPQKVEQTN